MFIESPDTGRCYVVTGEDLLPLAPLTPLEKVIEVSFRLAVFICEGNTGHSAIDNDEIYLVMVKSVPSKS